MRNHLPLLILLRDIIRQHWPIFYAELFHAIDDLAENALHADARVFGVPHPDVGAVEVDGRELADFVGEAGGVEVGFYGAD